MGQNPYQLRILEHRHIKSIAKTGKNYDTAIVCAPTAMPFKPHKFGLRFERVSTGDCHAGSAALLKRGETETPHEHVAGDVGGGETTQPLLFVPQWLIMANAGACVTTLACEDTSTLST